MSKVNLKQWPKGSKTFFVFNKSWFWIKYFCNSMVENEGNMASFVFTS